MPPKERFHREVILDAAWAIARRDGIAAISARRVAAELGASTAPLYRQFESMHDLEQQIVDRAVANLRDAVQDRRVHDDPAINNGVLFAAYARAEPVLFHSLMLARHDYQFKLDELGQRWVDQMAAHPRYAGVRPTQMADLLDHLGPIMLGVAVNVWNGGWPEADLAFLARVVSQIADPVIDARLASYRG